LFYVWASLKKYHFCQLKSLGEETTTFTKLRVIFKDTAFGEVWFLESWRVFQREGPKIDTYSLLRLIFLFLQKHYLGILKPHPIKSTSCNVNCISRTKNKEISFGDLSHGG